jgi:hypothetical protein
LAGSSSLDKITFKSTFSGMKKEITVFDCVGRPLRKLMTAKQTLSLVGDLCLPRGVYFIKTSFR